MDVKKFFEAIGITLFIGLTILICVLVIKASKNTNDMSNRFETISGGYESAVLYDRETKVMYLWHYKGGYTIMVDDNGNPLLYEGE